MTAGHDGILPGAGCSEHGVGVGGSFSRRRSVVKARTVLIRVGHPGGRRGDIGPYCIMEGSDDTVDDTSGARDKQ